MGIYSDYWAEDTMLYRLNEQVHAKALSLSTIVFSA